MRSRSTAIAGRLGLPRRVVTILEGESLLNDATALVALNASIAAIVSAVSPPEIGLDFVVAVLVGTGVGFLTGFVVSWVRSRLHSAVLDTSLTLVTPFAAFLLGAGAARLGRARRRDRRAVSRLPARPWSRRRRPGSQNG